MRSKAFAKSERLARFLEFTIEEVLAGRGRELKEYLVGEEVYGRGSGYDPKIDSIVRVEAVRLRNKIKRFYETEGRRDAVVIRYPRGSYAPVFQERTTPARKSSAKTGQFKAVAVLPFVNMSGDAADEYFSDGLTEELINALVGLQHLRVVARTSAFQFKAKAVDIREIGRRLSADALVEGSVRR